MQLLILNEECLVSMIHQIVLTTSLPFVHTARRSYRLKDMMNCLDKKIEILFLFFWKDRKSYLLKEGEVVTRFP